MRVKISLGMLMSAMMLSSCNQLFNSGVPKCDDEEVKKLAIELYTNDNKPAYIFLFSWQAKEVIPDSNTNDIYEYALAHGKTESAAQIEVDEIKEKQEKKRNEWVKKEVAKDIEETKLSAIRTESIDKEAKKCRCKANVMSPLIEKNLGKNGKEIEYEAQATSDSDEIVVTIYTKN